MFRLKREFYFIKSDFESKERLSKTPKSSTKMIVPGKFQGNQFFIRNQRITNKKFKKYR